MRTAPKASLWNPFAVGVRGIIPQCHLQKPVLGSIGECLGSQREEWPAEGERFQPLLRAHWNNFERIRSPSVSWIDVALP